MVSEPYWHTLRRITVAGDVTTVGGVGFGTLDGNLDAARFAQPGRLAFAPNGDLYVSEWKGHDIRRVTAAGVVSTFAGSTRYGGKNGDGKSASFRDILGLAIDKEGNVLVADTAAIRKISPTGTVSTVAGRDSFDWGYADGPGAAAQFSTPRHPAFDGEGNLIVADAGTHTIRKVNPAGVVTTIAGAVWEWGMVDGSIADARFNTPNGIAVENDGTILVADEENGRVRAIGASGVTTRVSGLAKPAGMVIDGSGNLLVADWAESVVWQVGSKAQVAFGVRGQSGHADGTAAARLDEPWGLARSPTGDVFLGEYGGATVRRLRGAEVTTVAGTPRSNVTRTDGLPGSFGEVAAIAMGSTSLLVASSTAVFHVVLPK